MKKGTHTVGVQRQYTGAAGRIENAQVAVNLVYAGRRGHAAVDGELYIPGSWTCAPDRCRAAGLDEDTVFAGVAGCPAAVPSPRASPQRRPWGPAAGPPEALIG